MLDFLLQGVDRVMQFVDPHMRHTLQVFAPDSLLAVLLIHFFLVPILSRVFLPKLVAFPTAVCPSVVVLLSAVEVFDDIAQEPRRNENSRETIDEGYPQEGKHTTETGEEIGQGIVFDLRSLHKLFYHHIVVQAFMLGHLNRYVPLLNVPPNEFVFLYCGAPHHVPKLANGVVLPFASS